LSGKRSAGRRDLERLELPGCFLATRADPAQSDALAVRFPRAEINALGRTVYLPPDPEPAPTGRGTVLVCTAGTSDLAVAEEAAVSTRALKNRVERLTDVGVAGIHRLLTQTDVLRSASVIIVVAGMEGALPSVVSGSSKFHHRRADQHRLWRLVRRWRVALR
jgi:NCAIR mutase (PurE)-related protein